MANTEIEWLNVEAQDLNKNTTTGKERFPALKMEEKTIYELEIDFSAPFEKWVDQTNNTTKKILPVTHNGEKKVFFLNVANPIYKEIILAGKAGQTKFKIIRTGQAKATRYELVK